MVRSEKLLALLLVTGCLAACGGEPAEEDPGPRVERPAGKADLPGSCQGLCGSAKPAPGGCWCDEACDRYGDCCQDKRPVCDGEQGPSPTPPQAPAQNDPAYRIEGLRQWSIIGDALTAGHSQLQLVVTAPAETKVIDAWLDKGPGVRLTRKGQSFSYTASLKNLAAGPHRILLAADSKKVAFAQLTFQRSRPLYVTVTNDWDDPDNPDASLARQEALHARHAELRLTHFVGPYTFTDPSVSPARAQKLVDWLKGLRSQHEDEIGLHIHPYCNFVKTTTVSCRTTPSFAYASGDSTGYTVNLDAYSEAEVLALLQAADQIFVARGLGKPTSFRAGGWTAEIHTLRALSQNGFLVDGSGCNWSRLEEWKNYPGASLYAWNQQHWASINDTSQPYHPSMNELLSSAKPQLPLLEVPDNGLLVDYVTAAEMIDVFQRNWDGAPLAEARVYSIGYHPPNFSDSYYRRMDDALSHVDRYLASSDSGPVIFVTMSELARVFPPSK